MNTSDFVLTYEDRLNNASEPTPQEPSAVLSESLTQAQLNNLTKQDGNFTSISSSEQQINNRWMDFQLNAKVNIEESVDSISFLTVYTGGEFFTDGSFDSGTSYVE